MSSLKDVGIDEKLLNQESLEQFKMSMDPQAIPDLDDMLLHINNLLTFIESPHMIDLELNNKEEFERLIFTKYNSILPINIIRLMLEENRYDNLNKLLDMFNILTDVKHGKKDIFEEHEKFSEKMNAEYVYPKYGNKENFNEEVKKLKNNKSQNKHNTKKSDT